MATTTRPANDEVAPLSHDEAIIIFDEQAHRYLGMSGDEFIQAWDAGKFADPDQPGVMWLAVLLPLVRKDSAGSGRPNSR